MRFYFAFPDRALDYDCARCTALCCRGHGTAGHAERELVPLLLRDPRIAASVTGRRGKIVSFSTPASGCFYLEGNLCSIENEHGRASKPSLCRAFPFSRVLTAGETFVVLPNFLCPLDLPASDASRVPAGDHAELAAALDADGWLEQPFAALPLHASQTPDEFLRGELEFRDACGRALATGGTLPELLGEAYGGWLDAVADVLGLPPAGSEQPELERRVLALAPIWSASWGKREPHVRKRRVALARRLALAALSGVSITAQVVHRFVDLRRPLIALLADWDAPMPSGLLPATDDGASMLAATLIDAAARRGATVLDALGEGCAGLPTSDRIALVSTLAELHQKRAAPAPRH